MLRLRRKPDGSPLLSADGRGVRVEDSAGAARWVPVAAVTGGRELDLSPADRAEVAAALGAGPLPMAAPLPAPVEDRPPVVSDAQVAELQAAGVHLPPGSRTPIPPAAGTADPILAAKRRVAEAAAVTAEENARTARVRRERAEAGTGGGGRGQVITTVSLPEGEDPELDEARRQAALAELRRQQALADMESEQARIATEHLTGQVERKARGTTGPQLFWVGAAGWFVGMLLSIPLRAALAGMGYGDGVAMGCTFVLELAGIWFAIWAKLRRVREEKLAEIQAAAGGGPAPARRTGPTRGGTGRR